MTRTFVLAGLVASLALVPGGTAQSQGKGHDKDHKPDKAKAAGTYKPQKQENAGQMARKQSARAEKAQGMDKADKPDKAGREKSDKAKQAAGASVGVARGRVTTDVGGAVGPRNFRAFAASSKHGQRLAGRAVAQATKRGMSDDDFVIAPSGNRVQIRNRSGAVLLDLDDDRDLGVWRVVTERDRDKSGAPSFCRSGEGHPVWGRQWCVDKGFGLGSMEDVRWARALDFDNVVLRQPVATSGDLTRDVLLSVLGDVVFNRLAAQAITLGLAEPLSGRWMGEPSGPRVLLLSSGTRPVAEVVDLNRDDRADMLLVAIRP